ncbi:HDOD domain-containing protein [Botrimarina mediterranea]|uniref:HDOD domain-containing protein n=1 Tax=Botrimarina mediterranea TaxID=2528022 RepID=UPI00118A499F|nr:HDOD domain protein [Planctomycetes bacterium K2D]
MPPVEVTTLDALADRAGRLYSPPAVALEVLRLTDDPKIDGRALCKCLEGDPALAGKLLRVVNSSLYGLPRQVASLTEAIALLGVQPLKLLVLGFSIPDDLVAAATGEAMQLYWTETLTAAAAARQFAVEGWGRLGDEAFAVGLMQGVGQLVLFEQFGEAYATLVSGAARRESKHTLEGLERDALGFEHRELSAELVRRWRLPESFATAIGRQVDGLPLEDLQGDDACLAQALRLGNLLTRLLLYRDLESLPELINAAERYANLNRRQINKIVGSLCEETRQLAEALSAPLIEGLDYQQTLVEAHARLSLLSEQSAVRMMGMSRSTEEMDEDERLCRDLLLETRRLSAAVRVMVAGGLEPRNDPSHEEAKPARARRGVPAPVEICSRDWLLEKTDVAIGDSRETRSGLVLSVVEASCGDAKADADVIALRQWIDESPWASDFVRAVWAPTARNRAVVWMTGIDRIEVNRVWTAVGIALQKATPMTLDVGVAGVAHPTKGFQSEGLLTAAERCLAGAIAQAGPSVKSIEVF